MHSSFCCRAWQADLATNCRLAIRCRISFRIVLSGSLAGLIHILRMSGSGYYGFPESAKPRVETSEILVCWFTTGLLLALFAFLLKIGVAYSRGAFVVFYFLAPVGLLGVRKLTKIAMAAAVSRGAIGRRDIVLIGDFNEIAALEPRDLLAFFGVAEVNRFTLSREDDPLIRASADIRLLIPSPTL